MDIIVGTAGHIDHGKTSLIKALTGVDADRLPEEKKRGITIDLGFAEFKLGDLHIGFVDVPGHEKFVKNMLSGASGIDLVLLVVAADEGVMPQTREHFEISRLLGTKNGLVVLTKSDKVDAELLEIAKMDVAELVENSFLQDAPVIPVSSTDAMGFEELSRQLKEIGSLVPKRKNEKVAVLPIDRVFSVKGFGTVVTGTLASGAISVGDELEILPAHDLVRIRGIQTHDKQVENVISGNRTAVNLGGIEHNQIKRGDILTIPNWLTTVQMIDARIEVLAEAVNGLKTRQRVRVHFGTIEAIARIQVLNEEQEIQAGESDYVQLRFEYPIVAISGDRLIIRQYSPQNTIAGGIILDISPGKHKKKEISDTRAFLGSILDALDEGSCGKRLYLLIKRMKERGISLIEIRQQTAWTETTIESAINEEEFRDLIVRIDDRFITKDSFENAKERLLNILKEHHLANPLSKGITKESLYEFSYLNDAVYKGAIKSLEKANSLVAEENLVYSPEFRKELGVEEKRLKEKLLMLYVNAGLMPPKLSDAIEAARIETDISAQDARKLFQMLLDSGEVLKITEEMYFSKAAIDELCTRLKIHASKGDSNKFISVPEFKEIAGISRKYAIPLLEFLDIQRITRRAGDKRLIL